MADTVNLVLYPQVQNGAEVAAVKKKLQATLSVDAETVDSWYATVNPTAILTDVEASIAVKYVSAIQECGAQCNLQPSDRDKAAWRLEQKTNPDSTDLFVCPFCEHEEQVDKGSKLEKCPECGLVIAEWDKQDDPDTNRKELERLRELEREIVKELGIKPPSALWVFFEKYTISLSFAISLLIVALAGVGFRYLDLYLEHLAHEETVAAAPSEQIRDVALVVAVAVEMQQQGNQVVLTEIVDATQAMRGPGGEHDRKLCRPHSK
jgi:ribosomal protein L37AE/L43A